MLDAFGDLEKGLLPGIHLGRSDRLCLLFGLLRRTPQHFRVVGEFALLHEQAEDEPQERERRKCAFEEIADYAKRHFLVGIRGDGADNKPETAPDPDEGYDETEPDAPVAIRNKFAQSIACAHGFV